MKFLIFAMLFVLLFALSAQTASASRYKCVKYRSACRGRAYGSCRYYVRRRRCRRYRGRRRRCRIYRRKKRGYKCRRDGGSGDGGGDVLPPPPPPGPDPNVGQRFCSEQCVYTWRAARQYCNRSICFIRPCGAPGYYSCTRGTEKERPVLPITPRICGGGCKAIADFAGKCDSRFCEFRRCSSSGFSCVRKLFVEPTLPPSPTPTGTVTATATPTITPIVCPAICRLTFPSANANCAAAACKVILCQVANRTPVVEGFGCVSSVDPAFTNLPAVTGPIVAVSPSPPPTGSPPASSTPTASVPPTPTGTVMVSPSPSSMAVSASPTMTPGGAVSPSPSASPGVPPFLAGIQRNGTCFTRNGRISSTTGGQFNTAVDVCLRLIVNPSNVRSQIRSVTCTSGATPSVSISANPTAVAGLTAAQVYPIGAVLIIENSVFGSCDLANFNAMPAGETMTNRDVRILRRRRQQLRNTYLVITGVQGTAANARVTGTISTALRTFSGSVSVTRALANRMLVQDPMVDRMIEETKDVGPQLQSDPIGLVPVSRQGVSATFVSLGSASVTLTGTVVQQGGLESSTVVVGPSAVSGTTVYLCQGSSSLTTNANNIGSSDLLSITNVIQTGSVLEVSYGDGVPPLLYQDFFLVDGLAIIDSGATGTVSIERGADQFTVKTARYTFTQVGSPNTPSLTYVEQEIATAAVYSAGPQPTPQVPTGTQKSFTGQIGSIPQKFLAFPGNALAIQSLLLTTLASTSANVIAPVPSGLGPQCGVTHQVQISLSPSGSSQVVLSSGSVTAIANGGFPVTTLIYCFFDTLTMPVTVTPMP